MVNSELFELFPKHFIDKQVEITYSGGTITNTELFSESMELTESLSSESELRFGSCEASRIKFKIANVFLPMFGQEISVQMKLEDHHDTPFQIGRYKVTSDTPTADRRWRDIIAYDAMQEILDADVAAWYNKVLPDMESQTTMREFRKSFLEHFSVDEADPGQELVNDDMTVQRTIEPDQMSGKDVITAICEINGCFGHINREGKFAYIYLPQYIQGLYPANDLYPDHAPDYLPYQQETGHLYPQDPKGNVLGRKGSYISCKYEDFITKEIKRLQIRKEENDIGVIINEDKEGNTYIIQNNFLVYGKGTEELKKIAEKIFSKISGIIYRPYNAEVQGNPCFEVGDPIRLSTKYEIVESYVFERTLKGIQALRDSFSANGTETYGENLNTTHNSIVELRGKSNVLTRTIEETKSDLRDTEQNLRSTITQTASEIRSEVEKADEGLSSRITQNAESIETEVSRATKKETEIEGNLNSVNEDLSSRITQTAESITTEVTKKIEDETKRATEAESGLSGSLTTTREELTSKIEQNAESITTEVSRATKKEEEIDGTIQSTDERLSSKITQNAEGIQAEVERATTAEGTLSASVQVNADNIALKVSKDSVISEINQSAEKITIKAAKIDLEGLVSADEFTSKYATIDTLNANVANLNTVIAGKASVGDLNAVSARLGTVETNYISATSVAANYATITSLNAVDAKFSSLNANNIKAGTLSVNYLDVDGIIGKIATRSLVVGGNMSSTSVSTGGMSCSSLSVGARSFSAKSVYISSEKITINYLGY